jgi:hypothetical protein
LRVLAFQRQCNGKGGFPVEQIGHMIWRDYIVWGGQGQRIYDNIYLRNTKDEKNMTNVTCQKQTHAKKS